MTVKRPNTSDYLLSFTRHAETQIRNKGFNWDEIRRVYDAPANVYRSGKNRRHQHRVVGQGICLVGEFRDDKFVVVTVYKDAVVTPPREDQLDTVEGKQYAEQYEAGTYQRPQLNITRPA